jgi:hypothetical protein
MARIVKHQFNIHKVRSGLYVCFTNCVILWCILSPVIHRITLRTCWRMRTSMVNVSRVWKSTTYSNFTYVNTALELVPNRTVQKRKKMQMPVQQMVLHI